VKSGITATAVGSVADANRTLLERDEVAFLELASTPTLHRTVDVHGAVNDGFLGVGSGVE